MFKKIWNFISDEIEMIYGAFFKRGPKNHNPNVDSRWQGHDSAKATRFMKDEWEGRL